MRNSDQARAADLSVGRLFGEQVRQHRTKTALEFKGQIWTYGDLNRIANQCADFLLSKGVTKGQRIAILAMNSPIYIAIQLAAAKVGAIVACLNWRQAHTELTHCAHLARPQLLFVDAEFSSIGSQIANELAVERIDLNQQFEAELAALSNTDPVQIDAVGGEDLWLVLYTSGTTGWPKAAAISHRAVIARSAISALDGGVFPERPSVVWAPMFHMSGTDNVHIAMLLGGSLILLERFDAVELALLATERSIGILPLMPATVSPFIQALKQLARPVLAVERVGSMADLIAPHQIAEVTRLVNAPFRNTFGSTETGLAPASRGVIPVGLQPNVLSKTQSSFCAVRLVDPQGEEVADGEAGEVAVQSPSLFSGYLDGDQLDTSMLNDGWFLMGDVMVRNEDGSLDYVDRKKYLIKSGGENIYPAELERVLLASPRVEEAVVVRERHETWGEVPVAFVVRRDQSLNVDDVLALFTGRLASYKRPRRVVFIESSDLPKNTTGKIQRHLLEEHPALAAGSP